MELAILGLVLDSSVLIFAERRKLTAAQAIENVQKLLVGHRSCCLWSPLPRLAMASIALTRQKSANAAGLSSTI